jgi:hypothetical protein
LAERPSGYPHRAQWNVKPSCDTRSGTSLVPQFGQKRIASLRKEVLFEIPFFHPQLIQLEPVFQFTVWLILFIDWLA